MEGDAGASRLNPPPMSKIRRLRRRRPQIRQESESALEQTTTEATTEDPPELAAPAEQTTTEATTEDPPELAAPAEQTTTEATAEDPPDLEEPAQVLEAGIGRGPSRVGRAWLASISAALVLIAGGLGVGGFLALRFYQESQAIKQNDAAALQAAKDCVAATQAPDIDAISASERKIIECGTDEYRTQALLYSPMLVQAYQAANVHVQVSDMRAAVERNNDDGSVDVLVALRVKVSNDQADDQETGYRLRVRMALAEGEYRIAKLDQVTK